MKKSLRFLWLSLGLATLSGPPSGRAATVDVAIANFAFSPPNVTIHVGDAVRWTQSDSVSHTTTSGTTTGGVRHPDGLWNSGLMSRGQTFSHTFNSAGVFPYYCSPHFTSMTGTVTVLGANVPPTVALTSPADGASFPRDTAITLQATAIDSDGSVTQVQFFDGTDSLGVVTASPYTLSVSLLPGSHSLTAAATDNQGAVSTSAAVAVALTVASVAIPDPIPAFFAKGGITVELQTILDGLASPLGMVAPDDGSGRLFVYDQAGFIWVATAAGQMSEPLLDVHHRLVPLGVYDERGLLGVAAHPLFAQHPLVYTYTSEPDTGMADFMSVLPPGKTNNCQSVLAAWRIDPANTNRLDPASRHEILRIDKPESNHNGGAIHFGPDGFLYIAIGDGGNANDVGDGHAPGGNAQNLNVILGKLLRIDVDGTNSANTQYGIPLDNPFASQGGLGEIYAYGLRNPWSYSFDRATGQLYLGDVGQNNIEEVDLIVKGGNYGWNLQEGSFWFDPATGNVVTDPVRAAPPGLIDPIAEYGHGDGAVVIGGFVYRGTKLTALQGRYVFADWGTFGSPSGKLLYLTESNTITQLRLGLDDRQLGQWIKGFGEDADGELYVFTTRMLGPSGQTGRMLKIVPAPAPLTLTQKASQDSAHFTAFSTGGSGPFAVQKKSALADATWLNVAVTTNREVTLPVDGGAGFFRLADTASQRLIPLSVALDGASERPNPVTTGGAGFGLLRLDGNSLTFNIHYGGLSGPATMAHIHGPASTSVSGGVLISLAPFAISPLGVQGDFAGVVVLTDAQKALILGGQTYVNVHTAGYPAGEVRGQLAPVLMQVALSGANSRPDPVITAGAGLGTLALLGNQLTFQMAYQGLSGAATAAHIHGPTNASFNAGVQVDLAPSNGGAFGSNGIFSGSVTLTPSQLAWLIDGLTYVNVHTAAHPAGEMRGQIMPHPTGIPLSLVFSGDAEKPNAVATGGGGAGLLSLEGNTLFFNLTYSNLSAAATAAHIHGPATTAQSSPVAVDLSAYHVGAFGTHGAFAGSVVLTPDQRDLVLNGLAYVNVPTSAQPAGEIRGQLAPIWMVSSLTGGNEQPAPVVTDGSGSGAFALVGNQLTAVISYGGLAGTATASHIHGPASTFQAAGVLMDLGSFNGGSWGAAGGLIGTLTLNATNLASVIDGQTYVNVHSTAFGGGEIRGQITR